MNTEFEDPILLDSPLPMKATHSEEESLFSTDTAGAMGRVCLHRITDNPAPPSFPS